MPKKKLSVSPNTLNLLADCPRCFWLDFKQGIKRPAAPFPSLPSRMDLLIKAYCKPYRGQEDLPPLLEAAGLSGHLVDPKMNACQDTDTGLWVTGYLDECLETAEGFSPLDHKTRGYEVKQIYRGYQLQLDVYALLLERNGLKPNGIGVLVFYVPDDGAFENGVKFKLDVRTIAVSPANALKCVTNAREVLDLVTPPDSSQQCGYCHWATLTRS